MYSFLVFLHVMSALGLGSLVALPFALQQLYGRTGKEISVSLNMLKKVIRIGHYALLVLFLTGASMVLVYSAYPSVLWVVLSGLLLLVIGGLIGMISKELKRMSLAEKTENRFSNARSKLRVYSWLLVVVIIAAVFLMTNRHLF